MPQAAQDHPRSRGVYDVYDFCATKQSGSSPLARGLPRFRPRRRHRLWIIPARAGFTPSGMVLIFATRDHPRSRGVYASRKARRRISSGSSPLARGLQFCDALINRIARIIPARAGFTSVGDRPHTKPGDHPRSRGVYAELFERVLAHYGSSPLARGLLVRFHVRPEQGRIIPARAGFTAPRGCLPERSPDHPRSRGVYLRSRSTSSSTRGSSPLARGLRHSGRGRLRTRRIIPARAGFTRSATH